MAIVSFAFDSSTGTGTLTLALSNGTAAAIGSLRRLRVKYASNTLSVSTVAGGNCNISSGAGAGKWTRILGPTADTSGTVNRHETWIGTASNGNSTGKETITLTWSGTITGIAVDLMCRTFDNGNTATTWALDGTQQSLVNNASSASITYPSLTAANAGELATGGARVPSGGSYGTPSGGGFTWATTTDANGNPDIYSLSVGSGTVAPTQSTTASTSFADLVLIIASAGAVTNTLTLSVTGVGAVSLAKTPQGVKAVTGVGVVPAVLRTFERPLSVTGVGVVPALKKSVAKVETIAGVGAVSLAKLDSKPALSVTGVGVVSLARATARTLSVVGVGAVSLVKQPGKIAAVTGVGAVSLAKFATKNLKVTGAGSVALVKLDTKNVAVVGVGVVSLGQSIIAPPRLAFVLLYDEVAYSVAMTDELVYSATVMDDLAFGVGLRDEHPDVNL